MGVILEAFHWDCPRLENHEFQRSREDEWVDLRAPPRG